MIEDTSPKAMEVYYRLLREMTPSERGRLAAALWTAGHKQQLAGIKRQYPDATEDEIRYHLAVRRYGEALARKVFPKK